MSLSIGYTGTYMSRKIITFIGMSGVGKSYWTEKFAAQGYTTYSVDDILATELDQLIQQESGNQAVSYADTKVGDLAKWMGFPDDERYPQNSKIYLDYESRVTSECLQKCLASDKDCVLDTTGSVIYINEKILEALKASTTIVFLKTSEEKLREMFEEFKRNPKPIIWNDYYQPRSDETEEESLERCYKALLNSRIEAYTKLCHVAVDYDWHKQIGQTIEGMLARINL